MKIKHFLILFTLLPEPGMVTERNNAPCMNSKYLYQSTDIKSLSNSAFGKTLSSFTFAAERII